MNTKALLLTAVLGASLSSACSFYARSPDDYRKATREMLDTKSNWIKHCYEESRKTNATAKGTVVVHFLVEAKTGKVLAPELTSETTAPPELGACVIKAMEGLVLNPPDQRLGDATFSYEFKDG